MKVSIVLLVIGVLCGVHYASAWGKQGHMMIAQIAADRLGSSASNKVAQFLGTSGYSLADIAPKPDDYDHSPYGRWSGPCHYCNLPRDATSFNMRYCPQECVVKSIQNYTRILGGESRSPFQCDFTYGFEPCALEFLVHYVGDVHQPLHVSYADDEGGNKVKVEFFNRKANLHQVWDELIIQRWNSDFQSGTKELEAIISSNPTQVKKYLSVMDPIIWANESYTYVLNTVYNFDEVITKRQTPHLGTAYYDRNLPIVKQRLVAAGVRLGQLLNNILLSFKN
jgi:hypothetical protein